MDLDVTWFFQFVIFVVVLATLNGLLFKPFLRVLEARHQKTTGMRADVDRLERMSSEDRAVYEQRLKDARREAQREREALRQAGREEERRLLTEARAEVSRELSVMREQVAVREAATQKVLSVQTEELSRQLVRQILGREVA